MQLVWKTGSGHRRLLLLLLLGSAGRAQAAASTRQLHLHGHDGVRQVRTPLDLGHMSNPFGGGAPSAGFAGFAQSSQRPASPPNVGAGSVFGQPAAAPAPNGFSFGTAQGVQWGAQARPQVQSCIGALAQQHVKSDQRLSQLLFPQSTSRQQPARMEEPQQKQQQVRQRGELQTELQHRSDAGTAWCKAQHSVQHGVSVMQSEHRLC